MSSNPWARLATCETCSSPRCLEDVSSARRTMIAFSALSSVLRSSAVASFAAWAAALSLDREAARCPRSAAGSPAAHPWRLLRVESIRYELLMSPINPGGSGRIGIALVMSTFALTQIAACSSRVIRTFGSHGPPRTGPTKLGA